MQNVVKISCANIKCFQYVPFSFPESQLNGDVRGSGKLQEISFKTSNFQPSNAQMAARKSRFAKKYPKILPLLWGHLHMFKPFWMVENDQNFVANIYLCRKGKYWVLIFLSVCEASWRVGRRAMKFTPCILLGMYRKKLRKTKSSPGSPSLWILHLKY